MKIVNQRTDRIISSKNYDIILDEHTIRANCVTGGKTLLLGEYATEKRAREVFTWILGKFRTRESFIEMPLD